MAWSRTWYQCKLAQDHLFPLSRDHTCHETGLFWYLLQSWSFDFMCFIPNPGFGAPGFLLWLGQTTSSFPHAPVTMARLCTTSVQLHWPFVEKAQEAGGKPAALLGVGKPECCKYFFWSLSHYSHYYCGHFFNFNDFLGAIDFSPIKREQAY